MWLFKQCPKCIKGDLYFNGLYWECIQCGYEDYKRQVDVKLDKDEIMLWLQQPQTANKN